MYRTRIKICGLTRPQDAARAVAAGADACGVVFAPSSRQVSIERAALVLAEVPPPVARIGVFVDAEPDQVRTAVETCDLTAVQFHGHESPEACSVAPVPVIKAVKIGTEFGADMIEPYRGHVAALLLDTLSPRDAGGTGKVFSWHLITEIPGWAPPVFLAGGLRPDNVGDAIELLAPFGVDVSSGVESAPGVKDPARIDAFVAAVAAADARRRHSEVAS